MVHTTIARPDSDDDGDIELDALGRLDAAAPAGLAPAPAPQDGGRGFSTDAGGESSDSDAPVIFGWEKKDAVPSAAKSSPLSNGHTHAGASAGGGRSRAILAPASKPPSNGTLAFNTQHDRSRARNAANPKLGTGAAAALPAPMTAGPVTHLTVDPAEEERVRKACKLLIREYALQRLDPGAAAGIMDRYLLDMVVWSKLKAFKDQKGPHPGLLDNSRIAEGTPLRLKRFMVVPGTHFVVLLPETWIGLATLFGGATLGFSKAAYHRMPEQARVAVLVVLLSLHRTASTNRLPNLDHISITLVLQAMLPPTSSNAELKVPVVPGTGDTPKIEFTPLSLKVTWKSKSLTGAKTEATDVFETSRLVKMSEFHRKLARHFELDADTKIALFSKHNDMKVTSLKAVPNEMALVIRVQGGAGDDGGGFFGGGESDSENELPGDSCFKRNGGSSGRVNYPGAGRQLGYGSSRHSMTHHWDRDSRSSSPDWLIGSRKQSAGLSNLGNTCFMNSSLQCLANIKEFKDFFLTDRYEPEINRRNPIGHKGELAQAYADTVKAMWSTGATSYAPRKLKETVGRCESRFQGYEQHDSQEFISFLLDGLHEDLNRVQNKPAVPPVDTEHLTDEEGARQSWDAWKLRNDSKIVDLFSGQFKSTVQCPCCNKVSVTFDPFMVLSLPLPEQMVKLKIQLVWLDGRRRPTMYAIEVKKGAVPKDEVLQKISVLAQIRPEKLVCYKLDPGSMWHQYEYEVLSHPSDEVNPDTRSNDGNEFVVYELDPRPSHQPARTSVVWVRYSLKDRHSGLAADYKNVFEFPLVLTFSEEEVEADDFRFGPDAIREKFIRASRFAQQPGLDGSKYSPSGSPDGSPAGSPASCGDDAQKEKMKLLCDSTWCHFIDGDGDSVKRGNSLTPVALNFNSRRDADTFIERSKVSSVDHPSAANSDCGNDDDRITMRDCLELFQQQQVLDEDNLWYCSSCKDHKQASKRLEVWSLPDVLVIHLKRFSYTKYSRDKISTRVDFPIEDLNLEDYMKGPGSDAMMCNYDLVGVSHHSGYLGGGHYTATGKSPESGEWCNFDDSYVSGTDASTAKGNTSYVLFYRRKFSPHRDAEEAVITQATAAAAKAAVTEMAIDKDDEDTQELPYALHDAKRTDEAAERSAYPFGAGNGSPAEATSGSPPNPFAAASPTSSRSPSPCPMSSNPRSMSLSPTAAAPPPPPPPPPPPLDEPDDDADAAGFSTPPPDSLSDTGAPAAPVSVEEITR